MYKLTVSTRKLSQFIIHSIPTMATTAGYVKEVLPPVLDSTSNPPSLFDGTTRLYVSFICPYAQRTWIVRNYKGLQEKIKLVPIDLWNRPDWYKEKVYPRNKVPSLEHNNEVKGESLDLIKYIDENFEGPALLPNDPAKQQFDAINYLKAIHLAKELNKIDAYTATQWNPKEVLDRTKQRLGIK